MKKKKQQSSVNKYRILGVVSVFAFAVVLVASMFGLANSISGVKQIGVVKTPEAILASAGVSSEKDIYLSVAYYDQRSDKCVNIYNAGNSDEVAKRQFEWEECGYYNKNIEKGLVAYELGEDNLPVFRAGQMLPNRGLDDAKHWFSADGEKSASYIGALKMEYSQENAEFAFRKKAFYPVDNAQFSNGDVVNRDGHNHLFTMSFAVPFTVLANGGEAFEIAADDDTFVFVDNKLAIDMGGVHGVSKGRFEIRENGELYAASGDEDLAYSGIKVSSGNGAMLRVFHADRDASESTFDIAFKGMNITVVDTKLAENGGDQSMQIAYDPTNPAYEAPLGRSVVMEPDNTRGYIIMATINGVMIVVFSVLIVISARVAIRRKK